MTDDPSSTSPPGFWEKFMVPGNAGNMRFFVARASHFQRAQVSEEGSVTIDIPEPLRNPDLPADDSVHRPTAHFDGRYRRADSANCLMFWQGKWPAGLPYLKEKMEMFELALATTFGIPRESLSVQLVAAPYLDKQLNKPMAGVVVVALDRQHAHHLDAIEQMIMREHALAQEEARAKRENPPKPGRGR